MKKKIILGLIVPILITTSIFAKVSEAELRAQAQKWAGDNMAYKGLDEGMQERMKNAIKNAIIYWKFAALNDDVNTFEFKQKFFSDYKYINADKNSNKTFNETGLVIPGREEEYSETKKKYITTIDLAQEKAKAKIYFEAIEPQAKDLFIRLRL